MDNSMFVVDPAGFEAIDKQGRIDKDTGGDINDREAFATYTNSNAQDNWMLERFGTYTDGPNKGKPRARRLNSLGSGFTDMWMVPTDGDYNKPNYTYFDPFGFDGFVDIMEMGEEGSALLGEAAGAVGGATARTIVENLIGKKMKLGSKAAKYLDIAAANLGAGIGDIASRMLYREAQDFDTGIDVERGAPGQEMAELAVGGALTAGLGAGTDAIGALVKWGTNAGRNVLRGEKDTGPGSIEDTYQLQHDLANPPGTYVLDNGKVVHPQDGMPSIKVDIPSRGSRSRTGRTWSATFEDAIKRFPIAHGMFLKEWNKTKNQLVDGFLSFNDYIRNWETRNRQSLNNAVIYDGDEMHQAVDMVDYNTLRRETDNMIQSQDVPWERDIASAKNLIDDSRESAMRPAPADTLDESTLSKDTYKPKSEPLRQDPETGELSRDDSAIFWQGDVVNPPYMIVDEDGVRHFPEQNRTQLQDDFLELTKPVYSGDSRYPDPRDLDSGSWETWTNFVDDLQYRESLPDGGKQLMIREGYDPQMEVPNVTRMYSNQYRPRAQTKSEIREDAKWGQQKDNFDLTGLDAESVAMDDMGHGDYALFDSEINPDLLKAKPGKENTGLIAQEGAVQSKNRLERLADHKYNYAYEMVPSTFVANEPLANINALSNKWADDKTNWGVIKANEYRGANQVINKIQREFEAVPKLTMSDADIRTEWQNLIARKGTVRYSKDEKLVEKALNDGQTEDSVIQMFGASTVDSYNEKKAIKDSIKDVKGVKGKDFEKYLTWRKRDLRNQKVEDPDTGKMRKMTPEENPNIAKDADGKILYEDYGKKPSMEELVRLRNHFKDKYKNEGYMSEIIDALDADILQTATDKSPEAGQALLNARRWESKVQDEYVKPVLDVLIGKDTGTQAFNWMTSESKEGVKRFIDTTRLLPAPHKQAVKGNMLMRMLFENPENMSVDNFNLFNALDRYRNQISDSAKDALWGSELYQDDFVQREQIDKLFRFMDNIKGAADIENADKANAFFIATSAITGATGLGAGILSGFSGAGIASAATAGVGVPIAAVYVGAKLLTSRRFIDNVNTILDNAQTVGKWERFVKSGALGATLKRGFVTAVDEGIDDEYRAWVDSFYGSLGISEGEPVGSPEWQDRKELEGKRLEQSNEFDPEMARRALRREHADDPDFRGLDENTPLDALRWQ